MTPAEQQQWIDEHNFTCPGLNAKISDTQCKINRELPAQPGLRNSRPFACASCSRNSSPATVKQPRSDKVEVSPEAIIEAFSLKRSMQGAATHLKMHHQTLWRRVREYKLEGKLAEIRKERGGYGTGAYAMRGKR
jgi:hypothetical protein